MSPTDLFEHLGAPLVSVRQSWGSVRKKDGVVFLRVWQDQCKTIDGARFALIDLLPGAMTPQQDKWGREERRKHIELIRGGAPVYMVMCLVKDAASDPRDIKSVNSDDVFVGGQVREVEGKVWLQIVGRKPVREVAT